MIPIFRFYSDGMTQMFENIECEWPIFYTFLIIEGIFQGQEDQVIEQNLKYCLNKINKDWYSELKYYVNKILLRFVGFKNFWSADLYTRIKEVSKCSNVSVCWF